VYWNIDGKVFGGQLNRLIPGDFLIDGRINNICPCQRIIVSIIHIRSYTRSYLCVSDPAKEEAKLTLSSA
jgi:hypothetical protein